jgi:hypothetical protein
MRLSFRKIFIQSRQHTCKVCGSIPFQVNQPGTTLQYRWYSGIVKNFGPPEDSHDVESSSTIPGDSDTTKSESSDLHQSPLPTPELSTRTSQGEQAVRFKMPSLSSLQDPQELQTSMSTTSLRKRIVWFNPLQGVNPAYDMALAFLNQNRQQKIEAIQRLESRIARETQRFILPKHSS